MIEYANRDPLAELQKWSRKHYKYSIATGSNCQPGDGLSVTLESHCRKVSVSGYDMPEDGDNHPEDRDIGDVVLFALDQWHADRSAKRYRVFIDGIDESGFDPPHGLVFRHWIYSRSVMCELVGVSESEVIAKARSFVKYIPKAYIQCWEQGQVESVIAS